MGLFSRTPKPGPAAPEVRLTARVVGTVQAVGFRYRTAQKADALGLSGTVRNDDDGSVAIVAEGPRAAVEELAAWLKSADAPGRVEHVEDSMSPAEGKFRGFSIIG
jgi:acylphosphatase